MNLRKKRARNFFALLISIIFLVVAIGIFASIAPNNLNFNSKADDSLDQSAITELSSSSSSYGKFANNSKYSFTDSTKVSAYRTSADNTGSDITTVTVNSSATHGTQSNPYVIDNFAGWTHFVAQMQKSSSNIYGQGKYYVLAVDLDFNAAGAPAEKPLYCFGGTLYGLGHTISNWKYTEEDKSEKGMGLIRYSRWGSKTGLTLTDLNMENYELKDIGSTCGIFVGIVHSEDASILNCHSNGSLIRTSELSQDVWGGGIIGGTMRDSTNTGTYEINATIYRCSSNLDFRVSDNSIPTTFNVGSGGIAGFNNFGCNLYVYDCYALMRQTFVVSKAIAGFYSGAMVALSVIGKDQSMGGMTNFSNCVGKVVNDLTQAKNGLWFHGGITTFYENAGANVATTSSIENIFISGTSYGANAGTYKLWPWLARRSSGDNTTNGRGILKSTGEIFYTGEDSSAGVWNITTSGRYRGTMASGSNNGTLVGTATGNGDAQLWTKAKESTVLKSKIWSQKDNIGGAYSIQNSPVINKFESSPFTFNLKDAKSDGTDTILKTDTYNYGSTPGLTSQTSQTGKTFLGYTFDRTSTANPFKTLPIVSGSSYYGNMDLYAVWDVPDADVTKDISVSGGVEENGTIVADYGEVIMLTADIACAAMGSDITLEYEWRQGATVISTGENLSLTNVADSGTYTLYYKIKSSTNALWGSNAWRTAGSKTVKINGKTPVFDESSFAINGKAYIGMPMKDIDYFAQFLDDLSSPFVGGTVTWNGGANAKIDEDSVVEKDGKLYYSTQITYTPDPKVNPAYANYSAVTADVEFEVEYAKLIFEMDGINEPIKINATYGNKYTAGHVASEFEREFLKRLAESSDPAYNKVKSLVPCFDGVKISDYKTNGSDVEIDGDKTIKVTFEDVEYDVTFRYKDENGASQTHVEKCKYGAYLTTTWLDVPMGYVVNPWRFTDGEGNQRTWRFTPEGDEPVDQVTGDVTLESEFKELKLTLESIEVNPRGSYPAMTQLSDANLAVIGNYVTDSGEPYVINLPSGNGINSTYKVTVIDSPDGLLHCNFNKIKVEHSYNGNLVSEEITLVVTPLPIDTSNCGFESVSIAYGESVTLPKVKKLPEGAVGVSYRYFKGSTEIFDISEIVGDAERNVTYTIRAIFETEDDYTAEDLIAQLTIVVEEENEIKVPSFQSGSMAYNGKEQTVVLKGYDPEYMTMELTSSAKDAGTYTVRIKLADGYKFEDGTTSIEIDWTIEKAELSIIWDKFAFEYDGSEKQPKIKELSGLADGESIDILTEFAYVGDLGQIEVNSYKVTAVATDSSTWTDNYKLRGEERTYAILPAGMANAVLVTVEWDNTNFVFNDGIQHPTAIVKNYLTGEEITDITLTYGGAYYTSKYAGEYECSVSVNSPYFVLEGGKCTYTITPDENGNGISPDDTKEPGSSGDKDFANVTEFIKKWWQAIASGVSIVLIIIFTAKGISYAGKKKENKRNIENKYKTYYAATGLFGLSVTNWTVIAGVLMGLAVASLVFMLIERSGWKKSSRNLEDAKEEFERSENQRRDEDMKMMFMRMMGGGNGQGMPQGAYVQQGLGAEEMRGLISETVTAMLPGMQQMLPQQASFNDELVQKLIEKEEKNDETINRLIEQNERLMQQLAERPVEIVEKEVAATAAADDETIKRIVDSQEKFMERSQKQDETISKLMEKILELSANQPQQIIAAQPQVIEKEVCVEVPVEKIVEVPVEKIVEVPVETVVEKVVEKPIVISTEAVGEAEKSKQVKKTPSPKKAPAPRLTLEEAYAKLTKEQKKYFDGLREYAMSKDSKCKEKLSTYFTTIGPSTTNPFIKLTIKKGVTVALFKMEDEYLKDIRRNASGDGTKIKVKETEMPIGDKQAYDTAKDMVDLRIDQIERYSDFLKEQRAMKRK